MPMAPHEILDRVFERRELTLQAGDCLIQPRLCAFDIEMALIVLVFRHGSLMSRANGAWHRHVDYAVAPFLALSEILPVSGTETTGTPFAGSFVIRSFVRLFTNFKEHSVILRIAGLNRSIV
jgi:hypothetical protein